MLNFQKPIQTEEVRFISGSSNFVSQQRETNAFKSYKIIGELILGYFQARTEYLESVNKKLDKALSV